MKRKVALLMAAAMAFGLTACGGGGSTTETQPAPDNNEEVTTTEAAAGSDTPSTDGAKILRFGEMNPNVGYDTHKNTNSGATTVEECICETLYRWTDDNELVPLLAEDMPEISEDGLEYTFKLREGVKFHDGTDLTTEDVKYTWERMFTPETGALSTYMYDTIKGAKAMLAGEATELEGFEIIDDYNFKVTLEKPFSCFVKNLGVFYSAIYPSEACEAAGDDWGVTTLIGTGPYLFTSADTSKVCMDRNDNYWGETPHFDQIQVCFFDDNNTKLMAFENGDIDICQVQSDLYLQYQGSETAELFHEYYPLGTIFLNLNLSEEYAGQPNPLSDVKVREAMSLAIDRQTLVDGFLNGLGTPASGTINPYQLGYKQREPYAYDVAAAQAKLAESAYPDGFSFKATIRSQDQGEMICVQSDLAKIGIDMQIEVVDAGVWASERNGGNAQCQWMGWFPLYADADNNIYSWFYSTNAAGKSCFYNNSEFDALMDQARVSVDDTERQGLYEQADEIMSLQDYACIPLYYPTYIFATQDYVTNFNVGNLIYNLPYDVDFK